MKTLLFISFFIFSSLAFGQSCNTVPVVTGYGYLTNSQGQVTAYTDYLKGTVCIPKGMTYTEVANQAAFNTITVVPPKQSLTNAQQQAELIIEDEQNLAIQDLESQGLLTSAQAATAKARLTVLATAQAAAKIIRE